MTTAPRSVAVVATRLPEIDRRVLSQAWYSALHLAHESEQRGHRASPGFQTTSAYPAARLAAPSSKPAFAPATAHLSRIHSIGEVTSVERRNPVSDLSRRIERNLIRHLNHREASPVRPATLAISAGDGRVQLLVRHDRGTTRIVALCAPHLRERVDRALAHARFALAAAGTRIEAA